MTEGQKEKTLRDMYEALSYLDKEARKELLDEIYDLKKHMTKEQIDNVLMGL